MALFSLQPYKIELDLTYKVNTSNFNFILPNTVKFGISLNAYTKKKNDVNEAKHITFLFY